MAGPSREQEKNHPIETSVFVTYYVGDMDDYTLRRLYSFGAISRSLLLAYVFGAAEVNEGLLFFPLYTRIRKDKARVPSTYRLFNIQ